MKLFSLRRGLRFEVKHEDDAVGFSIMANRRWAKNVQRGCIAALVILALGWMLNQHWNNAKLRADVAALESMTLALRQERHDLKWRADAFEKEVVEWRHKNGINDEFSQLSKDNQFYVPPQAAPGNDAAEGK